MRIVGVDLFCGVGGLTRGLKEAGINVAAGYDIAASCKYPYEHNNNAQFIEKSVNDITPEEINGHFAGGDISLLAGCAPCQPFSKYTQKLPKDERWGLLYQFSRLIRECKPDLVTMENVPDLVRHDVYDDFKQELIDGGYHVDDKVIYCPDYGMAQTRKRLVLLASKLGSIELLPASHKADEYITVRQAIAHLPKLEAGQADTTDLLHRTSNLSPINLERIKASRPGGTWLDWPESLRAKCHTKDSGRGYSSVYGRMSWDEPSPTMTTQCYGFGNGRFGHPEQNRAISLREAAILQSFPDDYIFVEPGKPYEISKLGRMIGNAVPVKLGELVGNSIRQHLTMIQTQSG
ncbi:DNA cytosine methyltransferase [Shewanella algae]|uniref:DNA cytosine methyltransferase n=1 Tax=Shewanella algae TaxID=38313 RepID=UPI001182D20A|nr:DNA cytosine methyltransferase [Shewanella algae]TVK93754.1 DNA cytosine methyltransferase [Shewanella algae]